jgi:hypothetical protein
LSITIPPTSKECTQPFIKKLEFIRVLGGFVPPAVIECVLYPKKRKQKRQNLKTDFMELSEKIAKLKRLDKELIQLEDEITEDIKKVIDLSSPTAKDEIRKLIPFSSIVKDLLYMEINKNKQ